MDPTDGTDQAVPDAPDVKTFRGRSLEEVLPRIRAELGPDAIVLRRREGLGGGVGGFFQRPYVEVDARAPQGDERPLEIRSDRATAEGLASPAVQALFEQATPFADALAAAARDPRPLDEDTFSATIPRPEPPAPPREEPLPPPRSAGLYGPQPNVAAIEDVAPEPEPPAVAPEPADCVIAEPEPEPEPDPEPAPRAVAPGLADEDDFVTAEAEPAPRAVAPEPADEDDLVTAEPDAAPRAVTPDPADFVSVEPAPRAVPPRPADDEDNFVTVEPQSPPPAVPPRPADDEDDFVTIESEPARPGVETAERPAAADAAERRLIAAGLSAELAAAVVGEAVAHGLPFGSPRTFKKVVRSALARRIPVLSALGPGPRTVAFVGAGGAGKSLAIAHIAAAYAGVGADVAVVVLGGDSGALADRLEPLGVTVIGADDAAQAVKRLARRSPLLTLIDTPASGPGYPATQVKALGADLKALAPGEIHLALPATLSAAAAAEVAASLALLAPTHVALTHADETSRPGAPIELALAARKPVSYVCAREDAEPADPASLAQQLLP